eukprot:gene2707-3005_t
MQQQFSNKPLLLEAERKLAAGSTATKWFSMTGNASAVEGPAAAVLQEGQATGADPIVPVDHQQRLDFPSLRPSDDRQQAAGSSRQPSHHEPLGSDELKVMLSKGLQLVQHLQSTCPLAISTKVSYMRYLIEVLQLEQVHRDFSCHFDLPHLVSQLQAAKAMMTKSTTPPSATASLRRTSKLMGASGELPSETDRGSIALLPSPGIADPPSALPDPSVVASALLKDGIGPCEADDAVTVPSSADLAPGIVSDINEPVNSAALNVTWHALERSLMHLTVEVAAGNTTDQQGLLLQLDDALSALQALQPGDPGLQGFVTDYSRVYLWSSTGMLGPQVRKALQRMIGNVCS